MNKLVQKHNILKALFGWKSKKTKLLENDIERNLIMLYGDKWSLLSELKKKQTIELFKSDKNARTSLIQLTSDKIRLDASLITSSSEDYVIAPVPLPEVPKKTYTPVIEVGPLLLDRYEIDRTNSNNSESLQKPRENTLESPEMTRNSSTRIKDAAIIKRKRKKSSNGSDNGEYARGKQRYWESLNRTSRPAYQGPGSFGGGKTGGGGASGDWTGSNPTKKEKKEKDKKLLIATVLTNNTRTFNQAFAEARKKGLKTFWFNGKLYGTLLGTNPNWKKAGDARKETTSKERLIILPMDKNGNKLIPKPLYYNGIITAKAGTKIRKAVSGFLVPTIGADYVPLALRTGWNTLTNNTPILEAPVLTNTTPVFDDTDLKMPELVKAKITFGDRLRGRVGLKRLVADLQNQINSLNYRREWDSRYSNYADKVTKQYLDKARNASAAILKDILSLSPIQDSQWTGRWADRARIAGFNSELEVRDWQAANGLTADGKFGRRSAEKWNLLHGGDPNFQLLNLNMFGNSYTYRPLTSSRTEVAPPNDQSRDNPSTVSNSSKDFVNIKTSHGIIAIPKSDLQEGKSGVTKNGLEYTYNNGKIRFIKRPTFNRESYKAEVYNRPWYAVGNMTDRELAQREGKKYYRVNNKIFDTRTGIEVTPPNFRVG